MRTTTDRRTARTREVRKGGAWRGLPMVAAIFLLFLGLPAMADAAYEQVPGKFGTATDFFLVRSIAINNAGKGGVQAGSFYVVSGNRVLRYSAGKEGEEPQLEEQWGWAIAGGENQFVRCGAAYAGTAKPAEHTYENCVNAPSDAGGEEPGHFASLKSVAVDQATGDVYVLNQGSPDRRKNLIEVFTAKGDFVGEGFGDKGDDTSIPRESIAEGPQFIHASPGGIAVDTSGVVYLLDTEFIGVENIQPRVMSFKPCAAGDYANYCYRAGKDIATPPVSGKGAFELSLIGDNRLIVGSEVQIVEFALDVANPTPVCSRSVTGQVYGVAANEVTGEVFWFRHSDKRIYRFEACDESTGKWQELQSLVTKPAADAMFAMAVNPTISWGPERPGGALYAIEWSAEDAEQYGYVFAPAKGGFAPTVSAQSAINATASSAGLSAVIDPRGAEVSYYFEYLSAADYVANGETFEGAELPVTPLRAPASPGLLPAGVATKVTASVSGLEPDTPYVFRTVASSECNGSGQPSCVTVGDVASFATYPVSPLGLPDSRRYEMVSPAQKNGGQAMVADPSIFSCPTECKPPGVTGVGAVLPMQSSPDGGAVVYAGYPFSSTEGGSVYNSYLSSRSAAGWGTTAMTPPLYKWGTGEDLAYSADLSEHLIQTPRTNPPLSSPAPAGYANLYLQNAADPASLTPFFTSPPPNRSAESWRIQYGGHSPDFQAQFFAANDALTEATPDAPEPPPIAPSENDLYEWRGGALSLVNVLPGNAAVASGASFASASPDVHAVSADGSRVFWKAGGHLYLREDGQVTREVQHAGTFVSASEDGSEVLLSDGCLYSVAAEACTDLTEGKGGFVGMPAANGDLSRIYFVDKASLSAGVEAGSCQGAVSGDTQGKKEEAEGKVPPGLGCNLYLYEAGSVTRFIGTLAITDGIGGGGGLNDWGGDSSKLRTAEASPDGRYLAFASLVRLTGYPSVGSCFKSANGVASTGLCSEVFLYDSRAETLSCPSCNPTGEAPLGNSTLRRISPLQDRTPLPRYLTDQGRLFFDSQDRLSPRDVNNGVEDVYEFEPAGVGSCERDGGCISLISPGTGSVDSNFLAMSEGGSTVFFTTRERLVPKDTDELFDVYAAREGGGFPSETETQRPECQGESCQAVVRAPNDPTPSSSTFIGPGNLREAARKRNPSGCPKGKVKKQGKCVKKAHKNRNHKADRRAHR